MPAGTKFAVGDKVVISAEYAPGHLAGKVFTVGRVNPKNIVASPEGGGRGINYPAYALEHFTGQEISGVATTVPLPTLLDVGAVVTFKVSPPRGFTRESMFVVTKDDGRGKANVSPLFGDAGARYWRASNAMLEVRDAEYVRTHL